MSGLCRVLLSTEGVPADAAGAKPARWSFSEDTLTVEPEGGSPLSLPLARVSGISSEDGTLTLRLGGRLLHLSRLGADGPVLLDRLLAAWPPRRAETLRIGGRGEPWPLSGHVAESGGTPRPASLLLYEDLLLWAPRGEDLRPFFFALSGPCSFDAEAWALDLPGPSPLRLSRLGPKTGEAAERLKRSREALVRTAGEILGACLPSADPFDLAALAGHLLPGRALRLDEIASLAPSVPPALEGLLGRLPRRREAEALRRGLSPAEVFFAFTAREGAADGESPEEGEVPPACPPEESRTGGPDLPAVVWLLVRRGRRWVLEALSEQDRATYAFEAGEDLLPSLQALLLSPRFSREALYLPLEALTSDRAAYAAAARDLPFLRALRERLCLRAVHTSFDSWNAKLDL